VIVAVFVLRIALLELWQSQNLVSNIALISLLAVPFATLLTAVLSACDFALWVGNSIYWRFDRLRRQLIGGF